MLLGQNLDDEQMAQPRLFKSHKTYDKIQKGSKYIYILRNPADVLISFHRFYAGFVGIKLDTLPMKEVLELMGFGSN